MAKRVPCAGCGELRWPSTHAGAPTQPTCRKCRRTLRHGEPAAYKKRGCRCELCRAAWARYNAKFDRARRARLRGATRAGSIDPLEIYVRDQWQCGICLLPVDPHEKFPSPGAPTLDHIQPVSRGGAHVPENLQCAHFYCNTVKGARDVAA